MNPIITIVDSCKLKIEAFTCAALSEVPEAMIGLDDYSGEYVHVWIDPEGSYSLDPNHDHYWHVAELWVPKRQHRIVIEEFIQDGKTQIRENHVPLPVDLSLAVITMYELPE